MLGQIDTIISVPPSFVSQQSMSTGLHKSDHTAGRITEPEDNVFVNTSAPIPIKCGPAVANHLPDTIYLNPLLELHKGNAPEKDVAIAIEHLDPIDIDSSQKNIIGNSTTEVVAPTDHIVASAPMLYTVSDPNLLWIDQVPYIKKTKLGQGSFGTVSMLEMAIPFGTELELEEVHAGCTIQPKRDPLTGFFALRPASAGVVTSQVPIVIEDNQKNNTLNKQSKSKTPRFSLTGLQSTEINEKKDIQSGCDLFLIHQKATSKDMNAQIEDEESKIMPGSNVIQTQVEHGEQQRPQVAASQDIRVCSKTNAITFLHQDACLVGSGFHCALKHIKATSARHFAAFCSEVDLLWRLKNEVNIITIFASAVYSDIQEIFIVMELGAIDFATFLDELELQQPSWRTVKRIARFVEDILTAVNTAHDKNCIHSDLKPANFIMIRKYRKTSTAEKVIDFKGFNPDHYMLKLCDFGLAKHMPNLSSHLSIAEGCGTDLFMAPEMVHQPAEDGLLRVGYQADVWSIGVIIHLILHKLKAPHSHLLEKSRHRLWCGIVDEESAIILQTCAWLQTEGQTRHGLHDKDFWISLQNSCLMYDQKERPKVAELLNLVRIHRRSFPDCQSVLDNTSSTLSEDSLHHAIILSKFVKKFKLLQRRRVCYPVREGSDSNASCGKEKGSSSSVESKASLNKSEQVEVQHEDCSQHFGSVVLIQSNKSSYNKTKSIIWIVVTVLSLLVVSSVIVLILVVTIDKNKSNDSPDKLQTLKAERIPCCVSSSLSQSFNHGSPSPISFLSLKNHTYRVVLSAPSYTLKHSSEVLSATFSIDGAKIATASHCSAKMWDVESGEKLYTLEHGDRVKSATFSNDGTKIVTMSNDKTAKIWDVKSGEKLHTLEHPSGVRSATFSNDGTKIVTMSKDKTAKIWDVKSGGQLHTLEHSDWVKSATFSNDGTKIVTTSLDKTAKIWDVKSGREFHTLEHSDWVRSATFSNDGTKIVTTSFDKTAKIWDCENGEKLHTLEHSNWVRSATFSNDGTKIVTASYDKTAKIWDVKSGGEFHTMELEHSDWVRSATFSNDGTKIVTTSFDKTAKIWDFENGGELYMLEHSNGVKSATFSKDGTKILTTSADDKTSQIWDVPTRLSL